jgi:Leucine-rich repeat (LRR) protein
LVTAIAVVGGLNELPRLKSLDLGGNAIQNIPQEVLKQGIEAIRAYQKKH